MVEHAKNTSKPWRIHPHDAHQVARLENQASIPSVVAHLLISRGVRDPQEAKNFIAAKLTGLRDPEELPGLTAAADRIHQEVRRGGRIVVYGDYDADGICAAALLFNCLQLLGADIHYYVPNRLEEGYGLNHDALKRLAKEGASLIITVDCGVSSVDEVETANQAGVEMIITDHHEIGPSLPAAAAIVHPRLPQTNYPFAGLCGSGVAFKLAWALCQRASDAKKVADPMREFLLGAVGLAAVGTVADVVPLLDENRILVRHGLVSLKSRTSIGLAELMRTTKLLEKTFLSAEDIAFSLAPHINAAGRLGDACLAVELLTTQSQERAQLLASHLENLNSQRRTCERRIHLAANKQVKENADLRNAPALVVAGHGWHPGVIGIVASRLVDKYHRPVVLLALDEIGAKPAAGSARAPQGYRLHEALAACSHHLLTHGGHAAAAGLTLNETNLDAFRTEFCEHVAQEYTDQHERPPLWIDAETPLGQLTLRTVQQIEQLAPFGHGNPRPLLCAAGVSITKPPTHMSGDRHLQTRLSHHGVTLRAIAFGREEWVEELTKHNAPIDIAFRPVINTFRQRQSVELHLEDWRPAAC